MKRFVLLLYVFVLGLFTVNAETVLPTYFNWRQIVCEIVPKRGSKGNTRSVFYTPQLYQSAQYISVQSECANYDNVYIIIVDSQGVVVKEDIMQVVAGGDNLYNIGDLAEGIYKITLEYPQFSLQGLIEK